MPKCLAGKSPKDMMEKTLLVTGRLNVLFDLNVCPFVTPVGIHQGESTIIAGNEIIQNVADIDGFCRRLGCIKKAFVDTTAISTTDHILPKHTYNPRPPDHCSYTVIKPMLTAIRLCTSCSQHNITMIAV